MPPGVSDSKVTPPVWTRPHRDEAEPVWVGVGGLGQEGIQFPALRGVPAPAALTNATCPLQKGCRRWQSAPRQHHPANPCWTRPTRWAGKSSGCFSSFPDASPGCREAKAGGSFDLCLYFYIKETLELSSLPSSAPGRLPGNGHHPDLGEHH